MLWRQYFGSNMLLLTFDEMLAECLTPRGCSACWLRPFPEELIRPLDMKHVRIRLRAAAAAAAAAAASGHDATKSQDGRRVGNGPDASTPALALAIECSLQRKLLRYFEPHMQVLRRQELMGQMLPGSCSDNVPLEQRAPRPKGRSDFVFVNDHRRRNELRSMAARRKMVAGAAPSPPFMIMIIGGRNRSNFVFH